MSTVAIKERPILFSGPMVRAILDGRKTQTRRIVKNESRANRDIDGIYWNCPYGLIGDRLWVRETWKPTGLFCAARPSMTKACGRFVYSADYASEKEMLPRDTIFPWRPSIHMPRWASRITLEITGVRVERLHDISNSDIVAEGFEATGAAQRMPDGSYAVAGRFEGTVSTLRQLFSMKWTEINGAGSWQANPWVWVIEFRRLPS